MARADEDPPLPPGTVIDGRYRVIAELGAGGMGRVYEAEHMFIRRRMALKLLRRGAGTAADAGARLIQEAMLAGQVPHPTIVKVFDCAAIAGEQVYVAMELLRGETLEQALRRRGDAATVLAWLADVARGLAAAHRAGVVHRDIKPANIFLARGESGVQAKLLDFGVAKALPGASELAELVRTQAGEVLGTPHYLAPEQAGGGALDGRADLYSLGVILYEVLTGTLPFVGEGFVAILAQHMRTPPLDPRQAAPSREIPDAVARLTMQLLAKDPNARPADGDAVADALAAALASDAAALARLPTGPTSAAATEVRRTAVRLPEETGEPGRAAETVRIAGEGDGEVSGRATVRFAEGAEGVSGRATVRFAEGAEGVSGRATVRIAEKAEEVSGRATVGLAGAASEGLSEETGVAHARRGPVGESGSRLSEGTGREGLSEGTGRAGRARLGWIGAGVVVLGGALVVGLRGGGGTARAPEVPAAGTVAAPVTGAAPRGEVAGPEAGEAPVKAAEVAPATAVEGDGPATDGTGGPATDGTGGPATDGTDGPATDGAGGPATPERPTKPGRPAKASKGGGKKPGGATKAAPTSGGLPLKPDVYDE
jgi:serine/threonine-protein kinase